jgi:hypothetical protein
MIGSAEYVDRNWDRLRRDAVAYLQIDQPGCRGATRWMSHSNNELRRFQQRIDDRLLADRPHGWRRSTKIGDSSFFGLGVPMFAGIAAFDEAVLKETANATFGWWHHTDKNTLDKVDWDLLRLHAELYAAYAWELCTAAVLPFEFVSVADAIGGRLRELAGASDTLRLQPVIARAASFRVEALKFDQLCQDVQARYASGSINDPEPAEALNRCIKRLSRTLLAVESTAAGVYAHDPYGLTAQGTILPSLFDMRHLSTLPADSEDRWMLQVRLVRARNWIADALDDATGEISRTLAELRRLNPTWA